MGRYVTNAEFASINRELGKKRKMGCLSWIGLIVVVLIGVLVAGAFLSGRSRSDSPQAEKPISTPEVSSEPSEGEAVHEEEAEEVEQVKVVYPMRVWTDVNGKKMTARWVKTTENDMLYLTKKREADNADRP